MWLWEPAPRWLHARPRARPHRPQRCRRRCAAAPATTPRRHRAPARRPPPAGALHLWTLPPNRRRATPWRRCRGRTCMDVAWCWSGPRRRVAWTSCAPRRVRAGSAVHGCSVQPCPRSVQQAAWRCQHWAACMGCGHAMEHCGQALPNEVAALHCPVAANCGGQPSCAAGRSRDGCGWRSSSCRNASGVGSNIMLWHLLITPL